MTEITPAFENQVLDILAEVCESDEVKNEPDIRLFEEGLMDSFATIALLVEVGERMGIDVPISDFNRNQWATPNMIIQQLADRK
ncbi:D-alanine--poly(phosphoribitol) ligase subunit DltC [Sporolactobacillus shoreae]|uniref:D-alanyl carrier protein n=1 Tax=Sporolactobacillus shoreae TaxID=1465501 RepID=A0A4Z0GNT0_9BACL|nr:D-alanine--poly(phosphoribitol) ligase subunit DltC [Sporolactobacillus shoreae]TGA98843.1 D-alanine--poly(phosphoribitol) ligase subunit DltC [Sporolactobacillus shoreae]